MPVEHVVTIPQNEFESIPYALAVELAHQSRKSFGFKVVSREDGKEIADDLDNGLAEWFAGVLSLAWPAALKKLGESGRGTY
jgi:hypothetical protein